MITAAAPAVAGSTGWAHQATGFQSNGAVTVKSISGGLYASTQNPTGAMAKTNQNTSVQAPTVVIQATGSTQFNWSSDCYIFRFDNYTAGTAYAIGAGKYDSSAATFSGLLGNAGSSAHTGGAVVMSMLTGATVAGSTNSALYQCGNNPGCVGSLLNSTAYGLIFVVQNMPTTAIPVSKCYP
jgi:hypothetical protein